MKRAGTDPPAASNLKEKQPKKQSRLTQQSIGMLAGAFYMARFDRLLVDDVLDAAVTRRAPRAGPGTTHDGRKFLAAMQLHALPDV
jgi:hypothetical protein